MSNFELRLHNSMAKILPQQAPPPENICLHALRGERVAFQLSFTGTGSRKWLKLKMSAPAGIALTARRVNYVPAGISAVWKTDYGYISTQPGLYPDLLTPLDLNRLRYVPGTWQSVWIEAEISPECAAGTQKIAISIESEEGEKLCAQAVIDVAAAQLPPLAIPHTRWFHTDCLAQYYGVEVFSERYWQIVEKFAAYAVKHGMNMLLTPTFTPPLDTEIGNERLTVQLVDVTVNGDKYSFGFDKLTRWVEMCKRVGVEYYEIAHLFTQWGAKHAPKIVDVNGNRLFGWDTDATGPEYTNFLQQMLPALTAKLGELGIAEKCYFHVSDEPNIDSLEQYKAARNVIEPFLRGFKIMDALTNYDFFTQGVVTVPIPAVNHIEPFLEGDVPELWTYYCCSQSYKVPNLFIQQPGFRNRILGALLYKFNIAGFLQWGYNFYNCVHSVYPINPFLVTDADGTFPSGDPFIVYPGEGGEPWGSTRLSVANEAFSDLRALRKLEELAGREFVLGMLDEGLSTPLTFDEFPQSDEYILQLRKRVNAEIAKRV